MGCPAGLGVRRKVVYNGSVGAPALSIVASERLARLKAPAGLDLGAITPDEIAISILAEIVAVRRCKDTRGAASPA